MSIVHPIRRYRQLSLVQVDRSVVLECIINPPNVFQLATGHQHIMACHHVNTCQGCTFGARPKSSPVASQRSSARSFTGTEKATAELGPEKLSYRSANRTSTQEVRFVNWVACFQSRCLSKLPFRFLLLFCFEFARINEGSTWTKLIC